MPAWRCQRPNSLTTSSATAPIQVRKLWGVSAVKGTVGLASLLFLCATARSSEQTRLAGTPPVRIPDSFGVNIHFTGAPQKDLDMITAAGFKFVRMDFAWASVERERDKYNFQPYDELVEGLQARGVRALFILDYGNPVYGNDRAVIGPEMRKAFSAFAAAAAARYAGKGVIWELWNEPNLDQFWHPQPSVNDYTAMAREAGQAMRAADPECTIVGPAVSGFPWDFLEACFKAGVLEWWDAVTVHPYRNSPPETVVADYDRLRGLIRQYAPSGKTVPIISGEWGYSTFHYGGMSLSREQQAQYLVREFLVNLSQGVPLSIWYDWRDDGPDPKETEHNFGTITYDREPKPAYQAAKTLAAVLGGFKFAGRLATASTDEWVLRFRLDTQVALAIWTVRGPHPIEVTAPNGAVRCVSMLGEESQILPASGTLTVSATQSPTYVLWDENQGSDTLG